MGGARGGNRGDDLHAGGDADGEGRRRRATTAPAWSRRATRSRRRCGPRSNGRGDRRDIHPRLRGPARDRGPGDDRAGDRRAGARRSRRSSCPSAAAVWRPASRLRCAASGRTCEIVGVQAAACAPLAGRSRGGYTIAEGIAVKHPGELTSAILVDLLDDVVTVTDEEISEAIVLLLERVKLVVEGAGAASVAALLAGRVPAAAGRRSRFSPAATSTRRCSSR